MAIKLPTRNYFTFPELMIRWDCSESDIRILVANGELKPSYLLNLVGIVITFEESHDDVGPYWSPRAIKNEVDEDHDVDYLLECKTKSMEGFYYLLFPDQTGPLDCNFIFFSKNRNLKQGSDETCLMQMLSPKKPTPISMSDVVKNGAFFLEEIADFEAMHGAEPPSNVEEKPLEKRERDTLLTIIAALAKKANIDVESAGKAAEKISGLTDLIGANVSKRAIEDHLKKIPAALEVRLT